MGKKSRLSGDWVAPIFMILALMAIWLALTYLPSVFGTQWSGFGTDLWTYAPWLVLFVAALYTLKYLISRR